MKYIKSFTFVLFLSISLAGCDDDCPKPDCDCPDKYAPVCGCDGENYANACHAECADVCILESGTCQ